MRLVRFVSLVALTLVVGACESKGGINQSPTPQPQPPSNGTVEIKSWKVVSVESGAVLQPVEGTTNRYVWKGGLHYVSVVVKNPRNNGNIEVTLTPQWGAKQPVTSSFAQKDFPAEVSLDNFGIAAPVDAGESTLDISARETTQTSGPTQQLVVMRTR